MEGMMKRGAVALMALVWACSEKPDPETPIPTPKADPVVDLWTSIHKPAAHEAADWVNEISGADCVQVVEQTWPESEPETPGVVFVKVDDDWVGEGFSSRAGSPERGYGTIGLPSEIRSEDLAKTIAHSLLHILLGLGPGHHTGDGVFCSGRCDRTWTLSPDLTDRLRAFCEPPDSEP